MLSFRSLTDQEFNTKPTCNTFNIVELIQEAIDDFIVRTGFSAERIHYSCQKQNILVSLDIEMIRQAAANLLNNIAEHAGPEAKVEITINESSEKGVEMIIRDDGIGLEKDLQHEVFEPFKKGSGRGFGLGLAIVAAIVKLHGGAISIQSSPGAGTQITTCLPAIAIS